MRILVADAEAEKGRRGGPRPRITATVFGLDLGERLGWTPTGDQ